MKTALIVFAFIAVLFSFTLAFAAEAPPGIASRSGTPLPLQTQVVWQLKKVSIDGEPQNAFLNVSYETGGCGGSSASHKVGYRVTMDSMKRMTEDKTVDATLEITVTDSAPSTELACSSLVLKEDRISIRQLIQDHARELGVNLGDSETSYLFHYIISNPVSGALTFHRGEVLRR